MIEIKEIIDNVYLEIAILGLCVVTTILSGVLAICLVRLKRKKKVVIATPAPVKELPPELSCAGAQILGKRENQQDSYGIMGDEQTLLCVVADGMGGLQNGAEISGIVSYVFKENYNRLASMEYPEVELLHIVRSANEQAQSYIESTDGQPSGSTLVATYINDAKLHYVSVGDSRIYLMRNQQLIQLTREHIYAYELDLRMINGELSEEEALAHRERKSLTSYMGMGDLRHLDRNIEAISLQKDDVILLASDGVFGTLSSEEMIVAMNVLTPQEAVKNLMKLVDEKAKVKQDNATAIVVFYK